MASASVLARGRGRRLAEVRLCRATGVTRLRERVSPSPYIYWNALQLGHDCSRITSMQCDSASFPRLLRLDTRTYVRPSCSEVAALSRFVSGDGLIARIAGNGRGQGPTLPRWGGGHATRPRLQDEPAGATEPARRSGSMCAAQTSTIPTCMPSGGHSEIVFVAAGAHAIRVQRSSPRPLASRLVITACHLH
jgi:hypothetical protein